MAMRLSRVSPPSPQPLSPPEYRGGEGLSITLNALADVGRNLNRFERVVLADAAADRRHLAARQRRAIAGKLERIGHRLAAHPLEADVDVEHLVELRGADVVARRRDAREADVLA